MAVQTTLALSEREVLIGIGEGAGSLTGGSGGILRSAGRRGHRGHSSSVDAE
ncbi:hypothetical protein [Microbulbifer hainanensis]|uniref:hypothetical protein n=1 Tax=Microbulbifer hainanensis TaxID=2735675 RepID=UPI0018665318|nr:hypothetical protein [Microbulbifer hainanensis]